MCVCVCVWARACACVRACLHASIHACRWGWVGMCVCMHMLPWVCAHVHACGLAWGFACMVTRDVINAIFLILVSVRVGSPQLTDAHRDSGAVQILPGGSTHLGRSRARPREAGASASRGIGRVSTPAR